MHIADLLDRWEPRFSDREVVRFGDTAWTWSQWADRIRRHAGAQRAFGLRPGDRVAFLDKNHPACLETTMACALAGTVSALPNFRLAGDEIAYLLNDAGARLVFVGHEFVPVIESIRDQCPTLERVVVVGGDPADGPDGYEAWLAEAEPLAERHPAGPDDCFLQLYTSGTTGRPKGAMLTHRGVIAHSEAGASYFGVDSESVAQVAMPLYHVGGTSWALIPLNEGGRIVIDRDVVPAAVVDEFESAGITHTFLVPAVLAMILALPDVGDRDFSSLQVVSYGSSPIPAPVLRGCLATLKSDFLGLYGMTETAGILTALPREAHRDEANLHRLASVGKPMPGVELSIRNPESYEEEPAGVQGEIWVRTAQLLIGYANKPEETAKVLRPDGWFRTGDAGKVDEDGFLYITDRVKDMIISGGENVYPAEIERVLVEHEGVAEVAVIGVPDPKWGETPKAVVVPATGAAEDAAELIEYCRARLARFKCPSSVEFVEALPRNPTGKVLKTELRKTFAAG
jgi:acyl-CoA synthetase (AMP-forming)/AMP-acid ligase II